MLKPLKKKQLVTIALWAVFVCATLDLLWLDTIFHWISDSRWLGKDRFPWIDVVLGVLMFASTVVGICSFITCLIFGKNWQRIVSVVPGLVLLWFLSFFVAQHP